MEEKKKGIGERSRRSAEQLAWWLAPGGNGIWFGNQGGGFGGRRS